MRSAVRQRPTHHAPGGGFRVTHALECHRSSGYGLYVRTWVLLVGEVLAAACAARPEAQLLALPEGRFQSYIVSRNEADRWTAMAATSSAALFAPDLRDSGSLWLTTYDEELSALGLAPGLVRAGAPSCQRACSLLRPVNSYHTGGDRPTWRAVLDSEVPRELWGLLVPDADRCTSPCGRMLVRSMPLNTNAEGRLLLRFRDLVLVATNSGTLLRVDPDQNVAEVWCTGLPGPLDAGAVFDDVLYVGSSELVMVDLSSTVPGGPCAIAEREVWPGSDRIRGLLAVGDASAPRLFVATSSGVVLERRSGSWRVLASLKLLPADQRDGTAVASLALLEDQSVVATVGGGELFRYREDEGVIIEEPQLDDTPLQIRALADGGPRGAVLAVDNVGLIAKGPLGWRRLVNGSQPWSLPGVVVRVGPRFIFSAFVSVLVPVYPGFGECPAAASVGFGASVAGLALGPDRALFLDNRPTSHHGEPNKLLVVDFVPSCGAPL